MERIYLSKKHTMKKKLRILTRKYKFINLILLQPEKQNPTEYVKTLTKIFTERLMVKTSGEKQTFMTEFIRMGNNYRGILSNAIFIDPDSKVIDKDTYAIKASEINPNDGLSLKQWNFYFFPQYHRIAIQSNASIRQVAKFFQVTFASIFNEEEFNISIETDRGAIQRIIDAKGLSKLTVTLSYTNNDNVDEWEKILDGEMRDSGTNKAQFSFKSSVKGRIQLAKSKIISALLNLSKSNGNARATILRTDGKSEVINTDYYPKITGVSYKENEEPTQKLEEEVKQISEQKDKPNDV